MQSGHRAPLLASHMLAWYVLTSVCVVKGADDWCCHYDDRCQESMQQQPGRCGVRALNNSQGNVGAYLPTAMTE